MKEQTTVRQYFLSRGDVANGIWPCVDCYVSKDGGMFQHFYSYTYKTVEEALDWAKRSGVTLREDNYNGKD
jgi:hypothetical protein